MTSANSAQPTTRRVQRLRRTAKYAQPSSALPVPAAGLRENPARMIGSHMSARFTSSRCSWSFRGIPAFGFSTGRSKPSELPEHADPCARELGIGGFERVRQIVRSLELFRLRRTVLPSLVSRPHDGAVFGQSFEQP